MQSLIEQFDTFLFCFKRKGGLDMALFKIPPMLRMSLHYVNTLQVFNGFLCPLLALLTD